MTDIQNRRDLELLLSRFYDTLLQNAEMHRIFIDVARIDMAEHIVPITDFWEQVLFQTGDYKRNVMQLHVELNEKAKLTPELFRTWLSTFESTVEQNFSGPNAEKIKTRAVSIATIMQIKIA